MSGMREVVAVTSSAPTNSKALRLWEHETVKSPAVLTEVVRLPAHMGYLWDPKSGYHADADCQVHLQKMLRRWQVAGVWEIHFLLYFNCGLFGRCGATAEDAIHTIDALDEWLRAQARPAEVNGWTCELRIWWLNEAESRYVMLLPTQWLKLGDAL